MGKSEDTRMSLGTADVTDDRIRQLRDLFPEAFAEGKVDFARLKQALGEAADEGRERYGLTWAGKAEAVRAVQAISTGALLPSREESVNFDATENLFIEGENLEVLKLLQKSYHAKIKMIYIDPPYNTGNDLIYPDNYREGLHDYLRYSGQLDDNGARLTANTETSGRFHSRWLSMMFPRLLLSRSLLREDGAIFVSIDDNEMPNLRLLMNAVFGEENFVGVIKRRAARKTAFLSNSMSDVCDYVVIYSRAALSEALSVGSVGENTRPVFNEGNAVVRRTIPAGTEARCPDGEYEAGHYAARTLRFELLERVVVQNGLTRNSAHVSGPFRVKQGILDQTLYITRNFSLRRHLLPEEKTAQKMISDVLDDPQCYNELGTEELDSLLAGRVFDNPKPTGLIRYLARALRSPDDDPFILLDFFAGSCTSAHALLDLSREDGGDWRFVVVQLPEPTPKGSAAREAGFQTISDIGKERIRRVISNLAASGRGELHLVNGNGPEDLGFKVFKLGSSNFKIWDPAQAPPDENGLAAQLKLYADHVLPGRSAQDILYELILKSGLPLTAPVEEKSIHGHAVYSVAEGSLVVCLEDKVSKKLLRGVMELKPKRVVCLDHAFGGNDQLKTNVVLEMRSHEIEFRTV